jgi:hypothetical protein
VYFTRHVVTTIPPKQPQRLLRILSSPSHLLHIRKMRDYNAIQFRSPSQKKQSVSGMTSSSTVTTSLSLSPIPTLAAASNANGAAISSPVSPTAPQSNSIAMPYLPDHPSSPEDASNKQPTTGIPRFRATTSLSPIRPVALKGSSTYRSSSPVDSAMTMSPTAGGNGAQPSRNMSTLSPSDALALRRDYHSNSELYINKLREEIQQHQQTIQKVSSASAKSDAVILELRSTIRQFKRQLERSSHPSNNATADKSEVTDRNDTGHGESTDASQNATIADLQRQLQEAQAKITTADLIRKELEDTIEAEQYTWELRVQDLERETAELKQQLLLAQEQPTMGQRSAAVFDEESSLELKQHLANAQNEIQHYRSIIMATSDATDGNSLMWKEKVSLLEQERTELQGCLDEALKELEAVDLELQQDSDPNQFLLAENERLEKLVLQYEQRISSSGLPPQQQRSIPSSVVGAVTSSTDVNVVEQLQYLYRWLLEHDDSEDDHDDNNRSNRWNQFDSADELVHRIQNHVELRVSRMQEIQQELSACKGDLRAKEESNEEMRNSLKEAVSLLRPLQDTVTKMENEKNRYHELYEKLQEQHDACLLEIRKHKQTINTKEDEIEQMKQEVESLELQLSKAKLQVANSVAAQHAGVSNRSIEMDVEALDEKRAKRRSGENNIKELLRDVQSRDIAASSGADVDDTNDGVDRLRDELSLKESEIADLEKKLLTVSKELEDIRGSAAPDRDLRGEVEQLQLQVGSLEEELKETRRLLGTKRDAERALNKSLKDALGLIKPLQIHLEESENEKRQVMKELEAYKRAPGNGSFVSQKDPQLSSLIGVVAPSQNTVSFEVVRELESTVRQLEKENAMLQDALEDMSQSLNASHVSGTSFILSPNNHSQVQPKFVSTSSKSTQEGKRLHQEFVELQSRYEVTQSRLKEAYSENLSLREQLSLAQVRPNSSQK